MYLQPDAEGESKISKLRRSTRSIQGKKICNVDDCLGDTEFLDFNLARPPVERFILLVFMVLTD